jgi:hypothetical protein
MSAVVFPGVGNRETLETIASYGEKVWITKVTQSWSESTSHSTSSGRGPEGGNSSTSSTTSTTEGQTESLHLIQRITTGDVRNARAGHGAEHISSNNRAVFIGNGEPVAVQTMPYYSTPPFREALISNAIWAASQGHHTLTSPQLSIDRLPQSWLTRYKSVLEPNTSIEQPHIPQIS